MPKPATRSPRSALWLVTWALALATPAAAQLPNQSFEVVPALARATVGDTIPLRLRVRLDITDLLYDSVPQPVAALAGGVRLISMEKLHREPDRSMVGRAVVVFFRPGRQAVPVLGLPFMRGVKGLTRGTLSSDSAFVEILPVAPPGNPDLKDIRDPLDQRAPGWWAAAGALAAAGAAGVELLRRRHEPRPEASAASVAPLPAPAQDPYEVATSRLREIEASGWSASGELAPWYAAVTDVLRDYLEAAHGLPASRRTSSELISLLPPALLPAGLRARLTRLLADSDEVKFARARPEAEAARGAVRSARLLLDAWHAAPVSPNAATHLSAAWGSPRWQAG